MPDPSLTYKSYTGLSHVRELDLDNKFSNYHGFDPQYNPNIVHPNYLKSKQDLSCVFDKYQSMLACFNVHCKIYTC